MKHLTTAIITLLFIDQAMAAKKALVIGGSSTRPPVERENVDPKDYPVHEFGRTTARWALGLKSQGYEVTTLFDMVGIQPQKVTSGSAEEMSLANIEVERSKLKKTQMARDFDKLGALDASAATKSNLIASLRKMRDELKPGDEFEFSINAHGYRFCRDANGVMQQVMPEAGRQLNNQSDCVHKIGLTNPVTGNTELVETSEIRDVLAEIDAKGIKTNLTLNSCHSGQAQDLFTGLNNTCVIFAASGNNVGLSCMPDDPVDDPLASFTSAADMVQASKFVGIEEQLLADKYFSEDKCTENLAKHYRQSNIGGNSRYDLFMSARRADRTFGEPTISSQTGLDYFKAGRESLVYVNFLGRAQEKMCTQTMGQEIDNLLRFEEKVTNEVARTQFQTLKASYMRLVEEYNANLEAQKRVKGEMVPIKQKVQEIAKGDFSKVPKELFDQLSVKDKEFEKLHQEALRVSQRFMAAERLMVDYANEQFMKAAIPANDPCKRQVAQQ